MSDLLSGVRVLEAALLFNGDYVGMNLGDMGADVIKVEAPGQGDYLRDMLGQLAPHWSPAHVQVNRAKRSVTLDLQSQEGREVFFELLQTADVFIDGYRAGACDRLGIGYEAQCAVKPDIIYCHYSGFGSQGPYAAIPTHGKMMNALAASVPLEMGEDEFVRQTATRDPMGGTASGGEATAAGGIHVVAHLLAALFRRERTGKGAYLDGSGADGVIASAWIGAVYGLNDHRINDRRGLQPVDAPAAKYQYYETKDERFVLFCCIEHKFWERFCAAVERPDLAARKDEQQPVDFAHGDTELRRELQSILHTRTQAEWVELAADVGIPLGPAHQGAASLLDDPHLRAREIMVEDVHPEVGPFTYVGAPVVTDGEPHVISRPAPALGAQTDEVLAELGYPAERIRAWREAGVI